ncbi:SufE family protein [Rhodothermus profundi]|uniref:Cysteine desulfuration protein SufE n=1 Tax=Rhodothermus profundi TaxID=633813 RepID=A0A1M6Q9M3_9BACT|nr:SufE family protein [Rhodothermus profundi]SHK16891.1 cysteine desulfuration protein SufE [Rhodothermus profundi]
MRKLDVLLEMFREADQDQRLELLLDFADRLPPLPPAYVPLRDAGIGMVRECQSPVFFLPEVQEGRVRIYADVPREAPTPRAFTALLIEAFDGEPPEAVLEAPEDLLSQLGIAPLLGMQRLRGLTAIYQRLRREIAEKAGFFANPSASPRGAKPAARPASSP